MFRGRTRQEEEKEISKHCPNTHTQREKTSKRDGEDDDDDDDGRVLVPPALLIPSAPQLTPSSAQ